MVVHDGHLRLLARTCIGRHDDYAVQREDGRYLRVRLPLELDDMRRHLLGVETIGTYVIDERGCCRFAVFDADSLDGLVQLLAVQRRLASDGICSALEGSRRGGHLWVFFASRVPASLVRRFLLPYCPPGVEFYPKQDQASYAHPGSLVRVPLGVHRRSGRRYPFLVPDSEGDRLVPAARSVAGSIDWLAQVPRVPVDVLNRAAPRESGGWPAPHTFVAGGRLGLASPDDRRSIHTWCDGQDARVVIGRYVELNRRGMGCCPFGWHHSDGKDSHPSLWVHPPRSSGGPCWYCNTWQRGGNLFDFLCLWHGITPRELWRRIRAGEQF